jgi:uncharacterized protein (TIGR03083 family)
MRPDILFVLAGECARVAETLSSLDGEAFTRPTRCPPWNVKELSAHIWNAMDRLPSSLGDAEPPTATADAVTYWRAYEPAADAASIVARSTDVAARFVDGPDLARSFEEHWRACVEAARAHDPGRLLRTRVADIRLDEFAATRVLEVAVHGLDLARALDREPWISPGGAEVTVTILRGLLGDDPPTGWDDVAFIEIGTGRRAPDRAEIAELGPTAARLLPLLA